MKDRKQQAFDELKAIWIKNAKEDLRWAKATFEDEFYAQACFVCQQVAEKAFKAYLYYQRQDLVRTHDLVRLLTACKKFDDSFRELKRAATTLTGYYVDTRYADDVDVVGFDRKIASRAVELAEEVFEFMEKKLGGV